MLNEFLVLDIANGVRLRAMQWTGMNDEMLSEIKALGYEVRLNTSDRSVHVISTATLHVLPVDCYLITTTNGEIVCVSTPKFFKKMYKIIDRWG